MVAYNEVASRSKEQAHSTKDGWQDKDAGNNGTAVVVGRGHVTVMWVNYQ